MPNLCLQCVKKFSSLRKYSITAYDKNGNAIAQAVTILINGKTYTDTELREIVKKHEKGNK